MAFLLLVISPDCLEVIATHCEYGGSSGAVMLDQQLSSRFDASWVTAAGLLVVP